MKKILIVAITTLGLVVGMGGPMVGTAEASKPAKFKVKAEVSSAKIISGQTVFVTGKVKPTAIGRKVILQKRYKKHDGRWKFVQTRRVDASGRFELTDRPTTARKRFYRVVKPAGDGQRRGVSDEMKVKVKPWDGRVDVRLFWNTGADLNLVLTDSNFDEISETQPGPSDSGGVYDVKRTMGCGATGAFERVYWPKDNAPVGGYYASVVVPDPTACAAVPTAWRVELRVNGKLVKTVRGSGNDFDMLEFGERGTW